MHVQFKNENVQQNIVICRILYKKKEANYRTNTTNSAMTRTDNEISTITDFIIQIAVNKILPFSIIILSFQQCTTIYKMHYIQPLIYVDRQV